MVAHYGISEQPAAVGQWSQTLGELHGRVAHRFARSEARERGCRPTAFSDSLSRHSVNKRKKKRKGRRSPQTLPAALITDTLWVSNPR